MQTNRLSSALKHQSQEGQVDNIVTVTSHRVSSFMRSCSFYSLKKTRGHTSHHPRGCSPNYLLFCMPLSRFLTLWMHHTNALELRCRQVNPLKFCDRNFVVCYSLAVVVHIGSRCQARFSKCHHKPILAHMIRRRFPLWLFTSDLLSLVF